MNGAPHPVAWNVVARRGRRRLYRRSGCGRGHCRRKRHQGLGTLGQGEPPQRRHAEAGQRIAHHQHTGPAIAERQWLAEKTRHTEQAGDLFVDQRRVRRAALERLRRVARQRARQRRMGVVGRNRQRAQAGGRGDQLRHLQGAVGGRGKQPGALNAKQHPQSVLQQGKCLGAPLAWRKWLCSADCAACAAYRRARRSNPAPFVCATTSISPKRCASWRTCAWLSPSNWAASPAPRWQGGERGAHVDAVHRVDTGNELIGKLEDAHQRMRCAPARQRLGVVAHGIGQPAVGVEFGQPVGGMRRRREIGVKILRQIVGEARGPGRLGIGHAGAHRQRLRQMRDANRLAPAHRMGYLRRPGCDRCGQQQRTQKVLLRAEIDGLQPQTQRQRGVAAHAGGKLRLRGSASHQQLQRLCHHTGCAETGR